MPHKYEYVVPHQEDVPNDRQRKAFRDINEQFKQIALDVGNLTTQVSAQSGGAPATQTPVLIQTLPSAQPIQQPSGGTTPGDAPADATYVTVADESASLPDSRHLVAGMNISFTDGGAGAGFTIAASGGGGGSPVFVLEIKSITDSPYSVPSGQNTALAASASAGADFIADLPAATGSGDLVLVTKEDSSAHNVVVTATGGDLINGFATYTMTTQFQAVWLIDLAAGVWRIVVVVAM